jgi:hypothetical protein
MMRTLHVALAPQPPRGVDPKRRAALDLDPRVAVLCYDVDLDAQPTGSQVMQAPCAPPAFAVHICGQREPLADAPPPPSKQKKGVT